MSVNWKQTKYALSTLESKLKCFICEELPVDPQLLWCKHSFCQTCIADRPKCPRCQFPVSPQEMVPDIMLSKLLQAMRVAAQVSEWKGEHKPDDKNKPDVTKSSNSFETTSGCTKNKDENKSNDKPSRKNSCERGDISAVDKQSNSVNMNEIKTKVLRRNSRSGSLGRSPQKGKAEIPEAVRKSRRRSHSLLKEKQKITEKKNPKTEPQNVSPKTLPRKSNIMATPKHKLPSKSSTPILFSAKKAHHTNKVNSKGETPLQIACRQGKLTLVQQLLRDGAEPNVKDYANWTPLCDAVGSGNVDVVRALLEAGAAVNTPANLNTTALVEAVMRRNTAMATLLLQHGADVHQRTALNNTALSLADDEMRAVLLSGAPIIVQPPPRVPPPPRAVLVDTELPQSQLDQVMELCRQFNLSLSTGFTEEITHVVVEKSATNTCTASTSVMLAIVSGCSVVGMDWVASCSNAGHLVAVDEFEPCGTTDFPTSDVFHKARLNKEQLLPRLFDGCHISLQHDQPWVGRLRQDTAALVTAAGAVYQPRQCDPERIPAGEATVMYHTDPAGPLGAVSHIILYQAGAPHEPLLKYNMAHAKSLSLEWFHKCIKTFSVALD